MIWPLRLRGSMQLTFKSISRYVVALVLVFATLLYTGIIRRTFYALPIAATKVFSVSITRLAIFSSVFTFIMYTRLVELPVTLFVDRLSHLMTFSDVTGSLREVMNGVSRESLPQSYEALKVVGVDFWHRELIFFVPMFEYWLVGFMFVGVFLMSVLFDKLRDRLVHV